MRKLISSLALCFIYTSAMAGNCPEAAATNIPTFCPTFDTSAQCHCVEHGLPKSACQDTMKIYKRMLVVYRTVERACASQHDTTPQTCMDDWNCYVNGGKDSQGRSCSGTGSHC